jgi:hypothetical protein
MGVTLLCLLILFIWAICIVVGLQRRSVEHNRQIERINAWQKEIAEWDARYRARIKRNP